ncbi:MAG: hypothetical protein FWD28_05590 [Treponema sp.]|nr:hypothetical protein [Treponema sp.]
MSNKSLLIILFIFLLTPHLYSQSDTLNEQRYARRIVWRGGENALRYLVEIEKLENRNYQRHLREYTTMLYIDVSLTIGEYRFRIIPYDILGRPSEGTQWMNFEVRLTVRQQLNEVLIIDAADYSSSGEQKSESESAAAERNHRFNTAGISIGSSFIDPLAIIILNGTYAPLQIQNIFFEIGCDFGFLSIYDDVELLFCVYPYINIGYFLPFNNKGGIFAGVGAGYMIGVYHFEDGKADISVYGINFFLGINLFDMINISYTFRTNFDNSSNKLSIGYVYRFME